VSRIDLILSFVNSLLLVSFAWYIEMASDNSGLNLSFSANSFSSTVIFLISSDLPIERCSSNQCSSCSMHFWIVDKTRMILHQSEVVKPCLRCLLQLKSGFATICHKLPLNLQVVVLTHEQPWMVCMRRDSQIITDFVFAFFL
jgi:hypothetical protein